ncbi:PAS domain S-box protein [Paraflavisolibacter sp. H34]|uniref:PAS domain-containing sensor histidine kinase n=1 Tax=Huijunlia imazamoxiresistens TaxID=3127457 RepID=UPI00301A4C70
MNQSFDPEHHFSNTAFDTAQFFSLSIDLFCIAGTNGYFKKVNPAFSALLGFTEEELLALPFMDLIHPDDRHKTQLESHAVRQGQKSGSFENRYRTKTGEYIWLSWSSTLVEKEGLIYAVAKDITDKKRNEQRLKEACDRYETLFNNAPLPQLIYELEHLRLVDVNDAAVGHYGYSREEFLRLTLYDIRPPEDHPAFHRTARRLRTEKGTLRLMGTHLKKNGEQIKVELITTRVDYQGQRVRLTTVNDITDKIRLQERLTRQKVQEQRKITQTSLAALEKERQHIGKELHDNVNQVLASTKMFLELALVRPDICGSLLEKSIEQIARAMEEIRLLSRSLAAPPVREIGLLSAIQNSLQPYLLANKFAVHLSTEGDLEQLHPDIQSTVFRIVQEQMNNISKHAEAANVWLHLAAGPDAVEVRLKDDGKGFDTSVVGAGIGLKNIRSRVALLQGNVWIQSQPAEGCTLSVFLPRQPQ